MKGLNVWGVLVLLCCVGLAVPAIAADYSENFNSYAAGSDPTGWLDTGASNSMTEVDNFKVQNVGGQMVFTTAATGVNIHSHYIGAGSLGWTNYVFTGRMMLDNNEGGIGVTFFSDYNNSDSYYRLRSEQGGTFHISPHGTAISGGTIDSGVAPIEGTWYLFRIEAEDTGTRSEIRAKIWAAGSSEPATWQMDCYDSNAGRLTAGRVGVWCMRHGNKCWDDFVVTGVPPITGVLEDFEAGYTDGTPIRLHPDWFTEDTRTDPTIENNVGIGGTWGISPGNPIFTWVAYPFSWATDLAVGDTVTMSMDFQVDSVGLLDDDRVGWMITDTDDSSDFIFGVQVDPEGSNLRLEGYWDHIISSDRDKRPVIDEIAGTLPAGAWYRLQADFTKLTATSCAIAASLTPLDGSGNPSGAAVLSGTIADTSLIGGGEDPDPGYFTPATIWPAYKNYNCTNCDGAADNAYFGLATGVPQTYTLTVNTVGSGTVTVDPDQAEYNYMDSVELTANPAAGWQFSGWSGDYTGTDNPHTVNITADLVITATFTEIPPVPENWTSYNDCVYDPALLGAGTNPNGQVVHYKVNNVTTYNIGNTSPGPTSGPLVDFATGAATGVTATLTSAGGVVWQPDVSTNWYGGYDTAIGTDARNTFGGIADMTGVIYYGSTGWYVDLTFTGLDPSKSYLFATSAARCNTSYTNRYTIYTISGVDAATNASTAGVIANNEWEVTFNTGDNYNEGYVARWTNINAGADGTFAVRATHSPTAESGYKSYAFDVFMLQTVSAGGPYTLTVNTVGSGTVTKDPNQAEYDYMDTVQLTAYPDSGWEFVSWSGSYTGSVNPASINITGDMTITATFREEGSAVGVLEDFESGYTDGTPIRLHPDWFTEDTRTNPTIENDAGMGGTWGISPGNPIFTWVAYPFSWATDLAVGDTVTMSMDFQVDSVGLLDDDRVGWMITDTDDSSDFIFGVQVDPEGSNLRLEGYWDHIISSDRDKRPVIDEIAGTLPAGAWYRLQADFTKLTATSCAIAASLTPLDGTGTPSGAAVLSGSIADTSLITGGDDPDTGYFTPATIWPAYKNYNCTNCDGAADNAYFGMSSGTPQTYTLTVNTVGNGTVTVDPDQAEYNYMDSVQLTANPASGWEFSEWSGDYAGTDNPCTVNMTSDMVITATFTLIPQLPQTWTAYNDCVYDPTRLGVATNPNGQLVHYKVDNVTTYNIGNNSPGPASGELVDFATGLGTGVTATLATNAGVVWQPDTSSSWTGGYDTAVGTDARNTFGDIADMTGVIYYASAAGWYVDLTISGLDPSKNYLLATSAARCNASYTNRYSVYTISGVDAATNASTSGVDVLSETQVSFNTGDNHGTGYVARWTNIDPGADGSFTVRATHSATAESGYKAYAFDVFMLQVVADPHKATDPSPGDTAADVGAAPILTWTPGLGAAAHQIYFGTSYDDVNDANTTVTLGVYQGEQPVDANYLDPGVLDFTQTYYWRADEVNDANLYKGDVWRFTTVTPVCETPPAGDINGDCIVDEWDLGVMAGDWLQAGTYGETAPVEYVIAISVDGLNSSYLQAVIDAENAPNFKRFQTEGAFTNNARTDYDITRTMPDHACMMTGRAVYGTEGHSVSFNSDTGGTIAIAHGSYVASGFDVVHDNSLRTGLYASKSKFDFFDRSYNAANGAADVTGVDDGTDKIDVYLNNTDTGALTSAFLPAMGADPFNLALVCYRDPDTAGESYGWGSTEYNNAIMVIDGYLGSIFNLVENEPALAGKTAIIVTADHGGFGTSHSDATDVNNYTVPFYVWAPGVPAGTDLYGLPDTKTDPGTGRPTYSDADQPIRNGNLLNLALTLLGFDTIPGSTINDMDLGVYASPGAYLEDFENATDYPAGSNIGDSADWYSVDNTAGDQAKITDTGGLVGSRGLTIGDQIFIWTAHPFKWTAVNLQAVMFEFDFKTDGSGVLDDDRAGWQISDSDTNSDFIFGVQIDPEASNTRLEGYWDHEINVDEDKRPVIDEITGNLSPNTWYRLSVMLSKLTDSSAKIDASLTELDAAGDPVGTPVLSGSIADTSLLGADAPDPAYFAPDALWPAYKNYDAVAGEADNAYFEVIANESCTPPMDCDMNGDCKVDATDLAYLANHWMECTLTPAGACP